MDGLSVERTVTNECIDSSSGPSHGPRLQRLTWHWFLFRTKVLSSNLLFFSKMCTMIEFWRSPLPCSNSQPGQRKSLILSRIRAFRVNFSGPSMIAFQNDERKMPTERTLSSVSASRSAYWITGFLLEVNREMTMTTTTITPTKKRKGLKCKVS